MQAPQQDQPTQDHPLARLIAHAAAGRFPVADGRWRRVPPWRPGLEGIFSFTGHAVLALVPDIPDQRLVELGVDGFGGATHPRLIAGLAGPDGWIDSLDVLLVSRGTGKTGGSGADLGGIAAGRAKAREGAARVGDLTAAQAGGGAASADAGPRLVDRPDLAAHHRAQFAAQIRDRPRILGYPDLRRSALAVISSGLAGLTELGFELEPERRGAGGGTALVRDALSTIPAGQLVVAAVAPGNAASLRALLAAGFWPLGSMQLFRRTPA